MTRGPDFIDRHASVRWALLIVAGLLAALGPVYVVAILLEGLGVL